MDILTKLKQKFGAYVLGVNELGVIIASDCPSDIKEEIKRYFRKLKELEEQENPIKNKRRGLRR